MIRIFCTLIIVIQLSFSQGLSDYSYFTSETSSLAGGIVSSIGGGWSLYNNPATLTDIENNNFSLSYSNLYNQKYLPLSSVGIIINNESLGIKNIGFKYTSFNVEYDNIELLDEKMFGLVGALSLLDDKNSTLSVGFSANYYIFNFYKSAGTHGDGTDGINNEDAIVSVGIDVGFLGTLREKNRIGIFIKNINSPLIGRANSIQNLPIKLDIGISTIPNEAVIINFSMEQLLGYSDPQFHTSLQYRINRFLSINTGVQINPNRFGCGLVITKNKLSVIYSFLTHHVLPSTHQCSIGIDF